MLDSDTLKELLTHYPVLHKIPTHLQHDLLASASLLKADDGTTFFDVDSPCRVFGLVFNGSIRVITPLANDRELVLYHVRPGQTCILTTGCLMSDSRYMARGIVEGPLLGAAVPGPLFTDLIAVAPAFRRFVFRQFTERVSHLISLIDAVGFQQLDKRLAALLVGRGRNILTTHQMLADELGTAREVISRILKQFEKDGWVHLGRGEIQVSDALALKQEAGLID